jgi:hypothetical protein
MGRSRDDDKLVQAGQSKPVPAAEEDLPPVVARLVVEIRSDGRRTIARGALEDLTTEQRVAVEARGTTPLSLAASLARSIFSLPSLTRKLLLRRPK